MSLQSKHSIEWSRRNSQTLFRRLVSCFCHTDFLMDATVALLSVFSTLPLYSVAVVSSLSAITSPLFVLFEKNLSCCRSIPWTLSFTRH